MSSPVEINISPVEDNPTTDSNYTNTNTNNNNANNNNNSSTLDNTFDAANDMVDRISLVMNRSFTSLHDAIAGNPAYSSLEKEDNNYTSNNNDNNGNNGNDEDSNYPRAVPSYSEAIEMQTLSSSNNQSNDIDAAAGVDAILPSNNIKPSTSQDGDDDDDDNDNDNNNNGDKKKKKKKKNQKKEPVQQVPLSTLLFRFASFSDKLLMFIGTLGAIAAGGAMPAMTIIFGEMIDVFTNYTQTSDLDKFKDDIIKFTLWFVGLAIVAFISSYIEMALWMIVGERLSKKIRLNYFRSILRQDIGWFDSQKAGDLTTRVQSDTHLIQEAIGEKVGTFFQHFTTFVAGFVIAFVKGWKLALVLLAIVPFLAICGGFFSKMLASATTKGQKAYAQAGAVAEEVFSSIRTVTSFSGQPLEMARYNKNLMAAFQTGVKKASASGLGIGVTYLLLFLAYALAFWFGSIMIDKGEMTSGGVLNVFFAILIGAFSLGHASPSLSAFGIGKGAGFHVFGVIDRNPPIDIESEQGRKLATVVGDISVKNVHFHYPTRPDVPILTGLALDIKHGTTVALVGASGCGKSTLISLIERFYDPLEGTIELDGVNLKDLELRWLREHVGIVSQEPVLFNMTIAENIRMGKATASDEEIYQAAKNANIHDFILSLPEAYATPVGERGTQLSGGQKQRIAIARALVKNPQILLLDEATSALDNESEKIVQDALDRASQGRTTIVIAHRLSTIQNADTIFVIGKGKVIEQGTHTELMRIPNGAYLALVTAQTLNKEEKKEGGGKDELKLDPTRKSATTDAGRVSTTANTGRTSTTTNPAGAGAGAASTTGGASSDTDADGAKKEEDPALKDYKVPIGRILALNRPELWAIMLGLLGAAANGVIMPIFSVLFAEIINVFAKTGDDLLEGGRFWAGMFVVLAVVTGLANYAQTFFFGYSGEKLTYRLREMSFKAILRQEIAFFDKPANATGALTARLAVDASLVQGMAGSRMGSMLQVLVNFIAGLVIAFVSGWKLTLVIIACVPLIVIAGALQMKALSGFANQGKLAYQHSGKIASEAIENVRTVTALNKQTYFLEEYGKHLLLPYKLGIRKSHAAGAGFGFSQAMMFFTYAVSFYYGGQLVADNEISFLEMMTTFSAVIFTAMAAGQMSQFAPDAAKAKQACYNVFELLDRKSAIDSLSEDGTQPPVQAASVTFENVTFAYPERPDITILDGLKISIPAGKTVAFVGASGCGKSTVMAILQRYYDAAAGTVKVDGVDVTTMNIAYLRSQMGLVGQEPVLFGTSIEENIRYGKPDATDEEIQQAAKNANIHNFIMNLPDKYKTEVGERGTQLSGGQKQRIAIARALIRNPKILLLDEATSALDTESEKIVQDALDRASKGRTTLVIAHRLSTIQNADIIMVFSKGKVVEQGTHQELLHRRGIYYQYATIQHKA